jgi:hypothetical protein
MGRKEVHTEFLVENNPDVDGKVILEQIFKEIRWDVVQWMHLAQDSDHWPALMIMVMKLWVP